MKSFEKHECIYQNYSGPDIFYNGKEWIYQTYNGETKPDFEVIKYCPYCGHNLMEYLE